MIMYKGKREDGKKFKIHPLIIVVIAVFAVIVIAAITIDSLIQPPVITPTPTPTEPIVTPTINNTDTPIVTTTPPGDEGYFTVPTVDGTKRKEGVYTIVVVGLDGDKTRTDTIMLISYDSVDKQFNLMSVYRDTMVNVSRRDKKINAAYGAGGIDRLKKELSTLIGFTPDFYVEVDLEGFVELVDAIGGVEFNIPEDMDYDDPEQNLFIHLKAGVQTLNGEDAMKLVRFRRYSSGDIERTKVQRDFLMATGNKLLSLSTIWKISDLVDIFSRYVKTDLSVPNLGWFATQLLSLNLSEDVKMFDMPFGGYGDYNGISYVYANESKMIEVINQNFNPYVEDITDVDIVKFKDE